MVKHQTHSLKRKARCVVMYWKIPLNKRKSFFFLSAEMLQEKLWDLFTKDELSDKTLHHIVSGIFETRFFFFFFLSPFSKVNNSGKKPHCCFTHFLRVSYIFPAKGQMYSPSKPTVYVMQFHVDSVRMHDKLVHLCGRGLLFHVGKIMNYQQGHECLRDKWEAALSHTK